MGVFFHYGINELKAQTDFFKNIHRIALIGAGTMGIGIAIDLLNKSPYDLLLIDVSDAALERAQRELSEYYAAQVEASRLLSEDRDSLLHRVTYTSDYSHLSDADIIWEIATERVEIKRSIFSSIEKHANTEKLGLIFSNTSSHTTGELAELFRSEKMREIFLTGHGYFPFHANRLFDVMKGPYASEEAFIRGVAFAEQILEKKVIALRSDHHGYITDPIFQAMGAIVSWDVKRAQDLVELPLVFAQLTANPFQVLDRTGHMPFTESAKHLGSALSGYDRLRSLYDQDGLRYPAWLAELESSGRIGLASPQGTGFFAWEGSKNKEKPVKGFDPSSLSYADIAPIDWPSFASIQQADEMDEAAGTFKSIDGLLHIAQADDMGGKTFRRYVIPILLYGLDLIQDGYATPGEVDASTKVGLRFKYGLCEIIDGFLSRLGFDGIQQLIARAAQENPDRLELFDIDGGLGPRKGKPSLLRAMKANEWSSLLGYGRIYKTPVAQRDIVSGAMQPYYNDIRLVLPNDKDRVASVIFDNPLRGNVWSKYALDQFDHAIGTCVELYKAGKLGAILFTAAGSGMRMLGADARQFNRGWFHPSKGYRFLGEEESAYFTKCGMAIFRFLQESPIWTIGAFGEKWGGGAEFSYFLNQRFDLISEGAVFDPSTRYAVRSEKKNYNQPEINYAILAGFGGVQELRRLGFGDSIIDEIFMQGLTAHRAYQIGLSNGIDTDPQRVLSSAYEVARTNQKFSAPYSASLYHKQKKDAFLLGTDDERLAHETSDTFNPAKNPSISTGILRLLNLGGKNPAMDLSVQGDLPGWDGEYEGIL